MKKMMKLLKIITSTSSIIIEDLPQPRVRTLFPSVRGKTRKRKTSSGRVIQLPKRIRDDDDE